MTLHVLGLQLWRHWFCVCSTNTKSSTSWWQISPVTWPAVVPHSRTKFRLLACRRNIEYCFDSEHVILDLIETSQHSKESFRSRKKLWFEWRRCPRLHGRLFKNNCSKLKIISGNVHNVLGSVLQFRVMAVYSRTIPHGSEWASRRFHRSKKL